MILYHPPENPVELQGGQVVITSISQTRKLRYSDV